MISAERRRSIWVVDDSPLEGERTAQALRSDYQISTFRDGSQVLEHLSGHTPPDVLVLEWVMPGITGIDVCRFIRASERAESKSIAILLLTGHQQVEHIVEGLSAGANDYLPKPYADPELRARVAALIRSRELLERAENAERALHAVLDSVPDVLFVLDDGGRVAYANAAAVQKLDLDTAAPGRAVSELVPGLSWKNPATEGGRVRTLADVTLGDELYSPVVQSFSDGDLLGGTTLSLRNVTERRTRDEKRLDYYSIVAHDLRSPLNAVLLRTELMLRGVRGKFDEAGSEELRGIRKNVHTLVDLINDFLDLARLESPMTRVDRQPLDLAGVLGALLDELKPLIDAEGHTLAVSIPTGPAMVLGDGVRLRQVLMNLVTNAVKFTPRGGRLSASVSLHDGGVEVRIADSGPGIDAAQMPSLSQRYFRAKGEKAPGTGLGLMIVREILEAHDSELHIASVVGEGSTFWFRLAEVTP